mgnify:CR=1 FL=1
MAGQDWMDQGDEHRKQIVKFIREFTRSERIAPTHREIADGVGLYKNSVQYHLKILADQGKIQYSPGKARSVRVVTRAR